MLRYILIVLVICLVIYSFINYRRNNIKDDNSYNKFLKIIKNAFNNILIGITGIPDIGNKTLVRLNHIDDLVDICEQVKKPIYYVEDNKSCDFILINNDEYCVYTLKDNEAIESLFEKYYKDFIEKNRADNTKILEDLDKTTIIKIQDGSSFKVSPLRDRDLRKIREKEFLSSLKENLLPKRKEDTEEEVV